MNNEEQSELLQKLETVLEDYLAGESDFTLDLKQWNISIRIKGPKWRGVVDKPLATFVLDLDRKMAEELARHGIDLPKNDHGLVALRVEHGSMLAFLEGVPEVFEAISKLPQEQQMMILIAVLVIAGVALPAKALITSVGERAKEKEQTARENKREEENTKREAIRANERLVTLNAITSGNTRYQLEAPLRGLVGKLGDNDVIELPGAKEGVKKKKAKASLAKSSRAKAKNYYIDNAYTVEGISTKNPAKWTISLNYGEITFTADLQLIDGDVQSLLADFKEAHGKNRKIGPWLHVTAEISKKGIRKATVVGLGRERNGSVKLADALRAEGYEFK